jgi:hypothetical protein
VQFRLIKCKSLAVFMFSMDNYSSGLKKIPLAKGRASFDTRNQSGTKTAMNSGSSLNSLMRRTHPILNCQYMMYVM